MLTKLCFLNFKKLFFPVKEILLKNKLHLVAEMHIMSEVLLINTIIIIMYLCAKKTFSAFA